MCPVSRVYKRVGPATIPDVSPCDWYQGYIRGWVLQLCVTMCPVSRVYKRVGPATIPEVSPRPACQDV